MRAVWYEENGPAAKVLKSGDFSLPALPEGMVRVRIHASGVNPSDVKRRDGWRGQAIAFPKVIPHNDGAGVVAEVGQGVDASRLGQRVWLHSAGWRRPFGTLAEETIVPDALAAPLPDVVTFEEAACLGVPAMTAHRAVTVAGDPNGKTVLIHGGAGSVGFYAIQLAKFLGATVLSTVSDAEKAAIAARAGADHVINYRNEDVAAAVHAVVSGGVDHVVDVDFAANLSVNLRSLKPDNGSIATFASMSDPEPKLPFYDLMIRNIGLHLIFVYQMPASAKARAIEDINHWLAQGRASHLIAQTFSLEQAVEAHEAVEQGRFVGNVVVNVAA